MLPRSPLLLLVPATLFSLPYFLLSKTPVTVSLAENLESSPSPPPQQFSNSDKYTLRGVVVNSATSEPIRGALVQVYFNGQSSMLTGPDGKFQFDGLPSAQTTVTVRKPGFFSENDFQSEQLRAEMISTGPNTPPLVLKLVPEGIIHGRISEEDGEPIEGLPVMLFSQNLQNGRKVWQQRFGGQTDEDGNFRIAELPPGTYSLSVGPGRNPVILSANSSQSVVRDVPLIYYPFGSDLSAAAPISITPGKKMEINLTVSPQPFFRVSGTVSGYPSGQPVSLQVRNSAGITLPYNWRFDSATGIFRNLWLPNGTYTLQAQANDGQGHPSTATVSLNVTGEISGVHFILLPTVNIPIRMQVIASRADTERFSNMENYYPAYLQLVSHRGDISETRFGARQVGERGARSLELQNVPPGTYTVEINSNGPFYVQSATSGVTNLLDSELSVAPGSSPQPIEITLRDDVATLTGTVSSDNQPVSATILAISEHPSIPPRIQPTDQKGGFQLAFLSPGAYKIIAVDHRDRLEYANPEAMRKYLSNVREVTLSPDQSAKIDLELVKVGE